MTNNLKWRVAFSTMKELHEQIIQMEDCGYELDKMVFSETLVFSQYENGVVKIEPRKTESTLHTVFIYGFVTEQDGSTRPCENDEIPQGFNVYVRKETPENTVHLFETLDKYEAQFADLNFARLYAGHLSNKFNCEVEKS